MALKYITLAAVVATASTQMATQTVSFNVGEMQDRVGAIEANLTIETANARTAASEAALQATLDALGLMTARFDVMQATVAGIQSDVSARMNAGMAHIESQMQAQTSSQQEAMTDANSRGTAAMEAVTSSIHATLSTTNSRISRTLSMAAAAAATRNASMYSRVALAVSAANNAATPSVYSQWGHKACTAPTGVAVTRLYAGWMWGSRHNYNGGGGNQLCLKDASGTGGGVQQGGHDSNDFVVPVRREHCNYNNMPSRGNVWRSRDGWVMPCAKCEYAKSCFMESGVAECPRNYHKMYTGYLFGGHQSHHGNNDRICIDKNPDSSDYNEGGGWGAHMYATLSRDASVGSRGGRVALACHQCCRQ